MTAIVQRGEKILSTEPGLSVSVFWPSLDSPKHEFQGKGQNRLVSITTFSKTLKMKVGVHRTVLEMSFIWQDTSLALIGSAWQQDPVSSPSFTTLGLYRQKGDRDMAGSIDHGCVFSDIITRIRTWREERLKIVLQLLSLQKGPEKHPIYSQTYT